MEESLNEAGTVLMTWVASYGIQVIGAIIILVAGFWTAGRITKVARKGMEKSGKVDELLVGFLSGFIRYTIIAVTLFAVLAQFGVETTSFIAVLGAAGLAIGLALQGTLSNVAAGVMLLFLRPFKVGHYIDAGGVAGTVKGVNLFTTELATPDNVQIIVPNSQVWGASIKNFSAHEDRRVDLLVGIAYEDDIQKALDILVDLAAADKRVKPDPEPFFAVGELADNSVNIVVRLWCTSGDYWGLKFDMTRAVKDTFDAKGISIPYPQRTVHMISQNG